MSNFLIVRLGALGDIVHAIPVAAAIRRAYPTARIDWVVGSRNREILDLVPIIDRRFVVHERGGRGGRGIVTTIRDLRQNQYDVTFDLQGLLKSAVMARASRATRVVGFAPAYLREPLARLFYRDLYDPGGRGIFDPNSSLHVIQANLGMLSRIGVTATVPEFPISYDDTEVARDVRMRAGQQYAVLNPGAAWPNKRWPAANFAALARELHQRLALPSVISWGPGELALAEEVGRQSAGAAIVLPATTIRDLVPIAARATVMVAGDTGPMHIAAALGTPVVGIFGPTRPARNGPWSARDISISRSDVCQCHHLRHCRAQRLCLLDISVGEVAGAVERRLATVAR